MDSLIATIYIIGPVFLAIPNLYFRSNSFRKAGMQLLTKLTLQFLFRTLLKDLPASNFLVCLFRGCIFLAVGVFIRNQRHFCLNWTPEKLSKLPHWRSYLFGYEKSVNSSIETLLKSTSSTLRLGSLRIFFLDISQRYKLHAHTRRD